MRIGLFIDLEGQREWHRWLSDDLARLGDQLIIVRPTGRSTTGCPAGLQLALWLDPIVYRLKGAHAFDVLAGQPIDDQDATAAAANPPFDVLIDASSSGGPRPSAHRTIRLLFNGRPSELGAVAVLLDDQPVAVTIDSGPGTYREEAEPGFAQRRCLTASLDNVFSTVVELLADRASSRFVPAGNGARLKPSHQIGLLSGTAEPQPDTPAGLRYLVNAISTKASNYLTRHLRTKQTWAIATRTCSGDGLLQGAWPATASFDIVPDDGRRYFADPIFYEHGGKRHLFAEEFSYATQRGLISVAEVDSDGRIGPFRPALERDVHLSYPFIFEHEGQIWMVPEACAGGAVELFRAVDYPRQWVHDRTLIDGVAGCDATIIRDGSRFVMILTTQRWLGTTWDNQRIFYAGSPLGPWTEHAGGLIRISNTLARPAGPALLRGGRQVRPVQNCSAIYGGGMTLLDVRYPEGGEPIETPIATLAATSPKGIVGTHTYARSGSLEAVDIYGDLAGVRSVEITCAPLPAANVAYEGTLTS